MIAIDHVQLAAPGLGLGTSFTGSITIASQACPPLIEALGIPDGHTADGTFVLGDPTEMYRRIPVRKPVEVIRR